MRRTALALAVLAGCGAQTLAAGEPARPATTAFPAPQSDAVVFSREAGSHVLAVGLSPAPGGTLARVSVVGQDGSGVRGLRVRVGSRAAAPCGRGCYERTLATGRPRTVAVTVRGSLSTSWRLGLPRRWPPPAGEALLVRAGRVWRALRSVRFHDRLASDAHHAVVTQWQMAAPDRVAYQVAGHGSAVIIGRRRWDRESGGRWIASKQDPPLRQPVPFWVEVADAHVLGTASVGGRRVWRVSFYDPGTPAWFEVLVDRRTFHTLDLRMVTTAHFMHERYSGFDEPLRIRPPVRG